MVVYIAQEVRDERFAIFAELLTRYDTDGVEVDLSLNNEYVLQYASHAVKFFNVARPPAMNKPLWRVHLPMVTLALLTDECNVAGLDRSPGLTSARLSWRPC